ncbi:MAG: hypothetical protein ACRD1V_00275, partial [Vicinamibacterales bacterium]
NIRVLDAGAPLAPLLAAARAVLTVNSTVALDGVVLGVPALVLGLPNNLSPFVETAAMAGAAVDAQDIRTTLLRLLYDQEFRRTLLSKSERATAPVLAGDDAAGRSAAAILALTRESA